MEIKATYLGVLLNISQSDDELSQENALMQFETLVQLLEVESSATRLSKDTLQVVLAATKRLDIPDGDILDSRISQLVLEVLENVANGKQFS